MRTLRISFTVSEVDAGGLLADLADRVSNLDFHVIEEVPHTKNKTAKHSNGHDSVPTDSLKGVILTALATGHQSSADLRSAISAAGYSAKSLNSALFTMQSDKQVKRVKHNTYGLGKKA